MNRRHWLRAILATSAGALGAADVHQHIRELADEAPLDMQFRGSTAD